MVELRDLRPEQFSLVSSDTALRVTAESDQAAKHAAGSVYDEKNKDKMKMKSSSNSDQGYRQFTFSTQQCSWQSPDV